MGCSQRLLCKPMGSTINALMGCYLMPNGQNQNGLKTKEREKEWGPREIETSLSPTQAQLQPLAHYLSSYHLRGAIVYKSTWELISNQCGTKA